MPDYIMFTDAWWKIFLADYSYTIGIFWALLKGIAVLDPENKSNKIIDLLQGVFKR
jgi:hypothetical protein